MRLEDAKRCDDAGDQFRRGNVEGRVAGTTAGIGQSHLLPTSATGHSPSTEHFVLASFLNRDGFAGLKFPVDGREWDGNVEWDTVPLCQDCLGVGANLVGHFAGASQRAIAADDDEVDLSALHQVAGGVVGDDVVCNALLGQLPRGEDGTLRARPCLVAKNMKCFAVGLRGVHRRSGRADVHEREPAGVAVGEYAGAVGDERLAVLAKLFAVGNVVIGELLGGHQGLCLPLGNGVAGHLRQHPAHGVERINGGGASLGKRAVHLGYVSIERRESAPLKGPRALRQAVCRCGTDCAGAADGHVGDGKGGCVIVGRGNDFEPVWK